MSHPKFTFEYNGEMLSAYALSKICGINKTVLRYRLGRGWSLEAAMNTPVRPPSAKASTSKASVEADISAKEKSDKVKIRDVGMFAQCTRRINSK